MWSDDPHRPRIAGQAVVEMVAVVMEIDALIARLTDSDREGPG